MGEGITGWVAEHRPLAADARRAGGRVRGHRSRAPTTICSNRCCRARCVGRQGRRGDRAVEPRVRRSSTSEDQRMLEVLAPHAAAAFQNARLLAAERDAAQTSARAPASCRKRSTGRHARRRHLPGGDRDDPHDRALRGRRRPTSATRRRGDFRLARLHVVAPGIASRPRPRSPTCPPRSPTRSCSARPEPFVDPARRRGRAGPRGSLGRRRGRRRSWSRRCGGSRTGSARSSIGRPSGPTSRSTSGHAARPRHRRHRRRWRSATLGASPSWSASTSWSRAWTRSSGRPTPTDLAFTFLGGRVDDMLGAGGRRRGPRRVARGATTSPTTTDAADRWRPAGPRSTRGEDRSLEYRVATPDGSTVWMRDVVHVVRGAPGPASSSVG